MTVAISQHVTKIIQRHAVAGILLQHLPECLLRLVKLFLPLIDGALQEADILFFLGTPRQFFRLGDGLFRFLPFPEPHVNLRKHDVRVAVIRSALEHGLGQLYALIGFAVIGHLLRQR